MSTVCACQAVATVAAPGFTASNRCMTRVPLGPPSSSSKSTAVITGHSQHPEVAPGRHLDSWHASIGSELMAPCASTGLLLPSLNTRLQAPSSQMFCSQNMPASQHHNLSKVQAASHLGSMFLGEATLQTSRALSTWLSSSPPARCRSHSKQRSTISATATGPITQETKTSAAKPKIAKTIEDKIGNTPMVYLNRVSARCCARIACKLEALQPCRSVKDRIALAMIEDAEARGLIVPGKSTLVEPTSGNTGVGLAFICASKGYKLVLCMPEDQSIERRILVQAFGAQVVLTPKELAMTGAIRKAEELSRKLPNSHSLQQFKNPANPRCHFETTGPEIWRDTKGQVDILVAAVGTGGTITGCGEFLKLQNRMVQIVAVEPAESAVISGGRPGYHQIQGIGAGFIPEVLNTDIVDEVIKVYSRDAFEMARRLHQEEGLMVGISSGAATHAAVQLGMRPENAGKLIVCVLPSFGERYISTPLFQRAWKDNLEEERRMPLGWMNKAEAEERSIG